MTTADTITRELKADESTTLAEIWSHGMRESDFAKIRDHFGVSAADAKKHSEPFPIALLLETNGLGDALWVAAHVAPDAVIRFLIRRLDEGGCSALKTLRSLDGDFTRQITAVETVVSLLRRKLAGDEVGYELSDASVRAAGAAHAVATYRTHDPIGIASNAAAYAARAAAHAVHAATADYGAAAAACEACDVAETAAAAAVHAATATDGAYADAVNAAHAAAAAACAAARDDLRRAAK